MAGILDAPKPQTAPAPNPWKSRIGLFGATLQDIGANLGGRPDAATNIEGFQEGQKKQQATAAANAARAALQQALATGDAAKIRQAMLGYVAAGGDPSGFIAAQRYGQPTLEHVGDNLLSVDPNNPTSANVLFRGEQRPMVNGGMTSMDNGKTWQPIPGYVDQQGRIADVRAAGTAAHRAPPKPTGGAPTRTGPF